MKSKESLKTPPPNCGIILELRNIVASLAPEAAEEFRNKGFILYDARRGGPVSAGICQILIIHDHIELAFIAWGFPA